MAANALEAAPQAAATREITLHWVRSGRDAEAAARSVDRQAVWIVKDLRLLRRLLRSVEWPPRRAGGLIVAGRPEPGLIPALLRRFERVAFTGDSRALLPKGELVEALTLPDRGDRFLGGIVDEESGTATLWRGDLTPLVVPLSTFSPTANGIRPDFGQFSVTDYGHTLRFGEYEAAADSVLYDFDPDFRRRLNRRRKAAERTLGASIRRLRTQRQLTREDFPGLDPRTLARIERNEVTQPHPSTLRRIAGRLGVSTDDLGNY